MTIPLACNHPEQNTYIFNTGASIADNNHGCCGGGGFFRSLFTYGGCGGSLFSGGCGGGLFSGGCGNNFWGSFATGAVLTVVSNIVSNVFCNIGQSCGQIFSGGYTGGWCDFGGWGGGFGDLACWGLGTGILPNSPIAQGLAQLDQIEQERLAYEAKFEKYSGVVNNVLEATEIEAKENSPFYTGLLNKCDAIKTANPNITDAELQARLENFAKASEYDFKLVTLGNSDTSEITVCETDNKKEAYKQLGKGYVELMDENHDGKTTLAEFVKYETKGSTDVKEQDAASKIADLLDGNKDGKLDEAELAAYCWMNSTCKDSTEPAEDETEVQDTAEKLTKEENSAFADTLDKVANKSEENTEEVLAFQEKHKKLTEEFRA